MTWMDKAERAQIQSRQSGKHKCVNIFSCSHWNFIEGDGYDVPFLWWWLCCDLVVPNSSFLTQAGDSQSTGTSCCRQWNDHQPSMHRRPNTRWWLFQIFLVFVSSIDLYLLKTLSNTAGVQIMWQKLDSKKTIIAVGETVIDPQVRWQQQPQSKQTMTSSFEEMSLWWEKALQNR